MPPDPPILLRPAGLVDAGAIAALHARSWSTAYRGMLSDAYLDGPIGGERRAFWAQRLGHPPAGLITIVAEREPGAPLGFVCALRDHDPAWGTLVDNLHVDPGLKRSGLGRRLLSALGQRLTAARETGPIYLFVLRANEAAAAFYARVGGQTVEHLTTTEPDGSTLPVARIAWPSLAAFAAGTASP